MKTSPLGKYLIILVIVLTVIIMTSCPPEITAPMVALVEDSIPPTINITSPKGGDNYYSSITVTGVISDDVKVENDGGGQIVSISYEIANDDFRKGRINIGLDDQITADTSFGSGTIDFDILTGEFSFTFSTISPNTLRDLLSLTIITVDRNNNKTVELLNLSESKGPYIDFNFYSSGDFNDESKITSLAGDRVYISGNIANSDYHLDTAEEIVSITWTVAGTSLGATLNITPDSSDWLETSGVFQTTNAFEDTEFFRYNPETKKFYTETFIDVEEGSKNFQLTAVDAYGHSATVEKLLTPPASLMMSTPTASPAYYAPEPYLAAARIITISSKITDPNDGILTSDQIASVKCSFVSTAQETAPSTVEDIYISGVDDFNTFFNIATEPGRFSFDITTADWPNTGALTGGANGDGDDGYIIDLTGDIYAKVIIEDNKGKTKNKSILIQKDDTLPAISNISFTGGTSGYLKRDDTTTLSFTATDTLSGVTGVEYVEINGQDVTGSVVPSGSNYSVNYTIPSGATSDADGTPVGYDIRIYDEAGNEATNTNASAKTFYGPYSGNSYTISSSIAATNSGNTTWARASGFPANDTVTVNFTSPRLLAGDPVVTLGGQPAAVTYDSGSGACTAVRTMDGSETTADLSLIPISAVSTDIVGNTETLELDTAVSYDKTRPAAPAAPTWPASPDNFVNIIEAGNDITIIAEYSSSGALGGDTVELFLDSTAEQLGSAGWEADDTADFTFAGSALGANGLKSIFSRVVDEAGNEGILSPSLSLIVDKTAPTAIAGTSYSADTSKTGIFNQDAAAGFEASDDESGVTIDNINWSVTTLSGDGTCIYSKNAATGALEISGFTTSGANADGEYQAALSVSDTAGNPSAGSFTFILDAVPLTATFSGLSATYVNAEPINLTSSYSGAESGVPSYSWNATTEPSAGAANFSAAGSADTILTPEDDGSYVIELILTDQVGRNITAISTSADYDFIREIEPPFFTNSITNKGSINTVFSETAIADDTTSGVASYQWKVDDDDSSSSWTPSPGATLHINDGDANQVSLTDGNYTATCNATDVAGNESTIDLSFTFTWDTQPPEITDVVFSSPGGTYLMNGDTVNLTFNAEDEFSSMDTPVVTIFSEGVTATPGAGISWSAAYTFTGKTSDADGAPVGYTISCTDELGHNAPASASPLIFYGPYDNNSFTGLSFSSDNGINSSWARATSTSYDELTVEFTSTRVLETNPTVTIAGENASVLKSGLVYTATYTLNGSESLNEGDSIPFTVSLTDAAGNSDAFDDSDTATVIYYDDTLPGAMNDCDLNDDDDFVNNDELTGEVISLIVNYGTSGAAIGDSVELYLDSISAANLLADTLVNNTTSQTVTIDKSKLTTDGLKTVRARIIDIAGNNGTADDSTPFTVDTVVDTCDAGNDHIDANSETSSFNQGSEDAGDSLSGMASYSWSFTPACTYTDNGPTSLEDISPSVSNDGTYIGELTVIDNAGNQATDDFTFIWDATQLTASITGVTSGAYINSLHLTAVDSGCESRVQSWAWSATTKPGAAGESFTPSDGEETDFNADKNGYYVVQVIIKDNLNRTDTASIDFNWDTTAPTFDDITDFGTVSDHFEVIPSNLDGTGSPINTATYKWVVTGIVSGTFEGASYDTLRIGPSGIDGPDDLVLSDNTTLPIHNGLYNVSFTVEDTAGNISAADTFSFTWAADGDGKAISGIAPKLSSGGSSGSGGTPGSGRITTANFDELAAAPQDATKYSYETSQATRQQAKLMMSSRNYSGSYSSMTTYPPAEITEPEALTVRAETTETIADTGETAKEPDFIEATNDYQYTDISTAAELKLNPIPQREPGPIIITALSSKASASATMRAAAKPAAENLETQRKPIGIIPVVSLLLLCGAPAVIIIRKRRL